jgi:hypothetical protein
VSHCLKDKALLVRHNVIDGIYLRLTLQLLLLVCLLGTGGNASADENGWDRFRPYGDFRLRMEQDWDSQRGDGTERDDRLRMRYRLRAGVEATINEQWSAVVAVRSGPNKSQQSPHTTIVDFDDGPTGPNDFNLDHWFLKYGNQGFSAWAGRNQLSFWHQDDLFIIDNVTFPGVGASYQHDFASGQLTWHLNYLALPAGMSKTSGDGLLGQVVYQRDFAQRGFTLALGYFDSNADPEDPDGEIFLTENNTRDYDLAHFVAQYRSQLFGRPYYVGLDYTRNLKNYDDEPVGSFSEFHKNDRGSYVLEAVWGKKGAKGDWLFGYYYSRVEALAVHSSLVSDDWVRWGNANQTRATNLVGSELRIIYSFGPKLNINSRLFIVDAVDLLEPGDISKEDGKRMRLDLNWIF